MTRKKYAIPGQSRKMTMTQLKNKIDIDDIFDILIDLGISTTGQYNRFLDAQGLSVPPVRSPFSRPRTRYVVVPSSQRTQTPIQRTVVRPTTRVNPTRVQVRTPIRRQVVRQNQQAPARPAPTRAGCTNKAFYSCQSSPNCYWTGAACISR